MLVETGPKDPAEFSKGTAQYIPGGVRQQPEERTVAALKRYGIDPADVSHVIVTHLHADHYDEIDAFPNARLVVNRSEFEANQDRLPSHVKTMLQHRPEMLQLVAESEVVPGIRVVSLGCHTIGSQAVVVETSLGPAVLTGDVAYKYENVEQDRPVRSADPQACRDALARIRQLADIVLPAHDPQILQRWPHGIIGANGKTPR